MNVSIDHDALLITNSTNIRYLTGFVSVAPDAREAYLLLTKERDYLFIHTMYLEQAKQLITSKQHAAISSKLKIIEISRDVSFFKQLAELCTKLMISTLEFEETDLKMAEYQSLKNELTAMTLEPTQGRIEQLRKIKRDEEIKYIKQAALLTDQCFDQIITKLKPGVIESEIAWEIEAFIRTRGASLAFSPIVAFGKHTSQPHYQPQSSLKRRGLFRLEPRDIVLLDFGARINGYCADMTRVLFLSNPKGEWKHTYNTLLNAQQTALDLLDQGERNGAVLDQKVRDIIVNAGYPPYPHSLGHNIGLDIHESPRLTIRKDVFLLSGMAFTVETGIYIEGSYGIRIEDLVILTSNGPEILSMSPKNLTIL